MKPAEHHTPETRHEIVCNSLPRIVINIPSIRTCDVMMYSMFYRRAVGRYLARRHWVQLLPDVFKIMI